MNHPNRIAKRNKHHISCIYYTEKELIQNIRFTENAAFPRSLFNLIEGKDALEKEWLTLPS